MGILEGDRGNEDVDRSKEFGIKEGKVMTENWQVKHLKMEERRNMLLVREERGTARIAT